MPLLPQERAFSGRVDEYARLMDASEEVMNVNGENDNESAINVECCLACAMSLLDSKDV